MIRLLLADDQAIFRQGLAALLSDESDLEVVGQAADGQEAIALTIQHQPDVVLMDVRMPCDGVSATREIHQRYPWIRILMLTTFDDDEYIWRSLNAGALGYLLKRTPAPQVAMAVRSVHLGYGQLSPAIAPKVFSNLKPNPAPSAAYQGLSPREQEILKRVGQGRNNQEIAQELHLSEGTVRNYVTQILSQLGMRDRIQAALWAHQQNL
jgi:DNA-binding NarL/FixJ family response regulator